MVGRLTMSACAGQRMSGEASGWVGWSISRTDWNHGLGCSHGVEPSQPGQQGSMVQLLSTISSSVALSVCAARLGAGAQLEGVVWHHEPPVRRTHTCVDRWVQKGRVVPMKPNWGTDVRNLRSALQPPRWPSTTLGLRLTRQLPRRPAHSICTIASTCRKEVCRITLRPI